MRLGVRISVAGALAAAIVVLLGGPTGPVNGATFDVTSTECSGPGSITDAIQEANANPGPDTISITPNLQIGPVVEGTCGVLNTDSGSFYIERVTDDLVIEGNGARIWGSQKWVTPDGLTNLPGRCPGSGDIVVRQSPGFVQIDGAALEVDDLTVENLSAFVRVNDGSSLTVKNSTLDQILDFAVPGQCDRPAIWAPFPAVVDITIENSRLVEILNAGDDFGRISPPFNEQVLWGSAVIDGRGMLTIDRSSFSVNGGAVQWGGGTVDMVSSRFGVFSGWMNVYGGTTANIVNSALEGGLPATWDEHARIIADDNSTVNIVASTLVTGLSDCPDRSEPPGAQCIGGPGVIQSKDGSTVNLAQSAFGVQIDAGVPALATYGGTITADELTWVQPLPGVTPPQDAAALETITAQPGLLTEPPGLPHGVVAIWPDSHFPLLGDTTTPGALIDVIADANCGNTNQLLSPINGSCITTDVLGNSRWDTGNNKRNIGALQETLAPHLAVTATGDGTVDLSWNTLYITTNPVDGYAVLYRPVGSSDPFTRIDVAGIETVTRQVTGLTNGTTYEFQVVGVSAGTDGPPSNLVTATPSTVPAAPTITPTPGDGQVTLNWTTPTDGGAPLLGYLVQYRAVGESSWQSLPDPGTGTSTAVTDLTNGTAYEFRVSAHNRNGDGPFSPIAQATPTGTAPTTTITPPTTLPPSLPETGSGITTGGTIAAMLMVLGGALALTARRRDTR